MAKFNWFILMCECVDLRIGPITNASLVSQRYHVTRFSRWRTTLSVIQIPAGKNVQMKARLILLRRLKGWEEAKIARETKLQTNPAVKTTIKPTSRANK